MDYTEEYSDTIRDTLGNQINALYSQSKGIELNESQTVEPLDLSQDRANYADNLEFAANREIAAAIQALENALREDASANDLETTVNLISELQVQVDGEITTLEADITRTNAAITNAEESLRLAQTRLNNAPTDADTTALENAVNAANQNYENQQNRLLEQENELNDYQTARRLIKQYLSQLNISSSGVGTQVSASLRSIQSNLLNGDVDVEKIEKEVGQIFEQLQASEDILNADNITYQTMMNEMDSFIRNIQKFIEIRASEQTLNELVDDLQNENKFTNTEWKTTWTEALENLKSVIGSLPSYLGSDNYTLRGYNRANSMDKLDDALRKYIPNHNAADQALIYLFNPYNNLALISFMLAFFLDISAFITGFIINIVDRRKTNKSIKNSLQSDISDIEQTVSIVQDNFASVPSTAHRYIFLTGDFTKEDDYYYYRALEGDEQIEVKMHKETLQSGFQVDVNGQFHAVIPQELALFRMQNGPRDGIYQNCCLQYSDHILTIKKNNDEDYFYLATMDDDVPVYQIRNNECVCQEVQDIPPQVWTTAILALNSKGTQVAAIYLM